MEVGPRLVDERDVSRDISVDQGKHNTYRLYYTRTMSGKRSYTVSPTASTGCLPIITGHYTSFNTTGAQKRIQPRLIRKENCGWASTDRRSKLASLRSGSATEYSPYDYYCHQPPRHHSYLHLHYTHRHHPSTALPPPPSTQPKIQARTLK